MKGKLIVIEGLDGSGKATQTKTLVKNLRKDGHKVKTIDFPRYYDNFFGKLIGEALIGEHGDFLKVSPRISSVLYAADRFETKDKINSWLQKGFVVVLDRYVSSNQIHQGGKTKSNKERKEFLKWLDEMEYKIFGLPKPNLVVFLDVPPRLSLKQVKNNKNQKTKKYTKGKKDLTENSFGYTMNSRKSALALLKENRNWKKVTCFKGQRILSIKDISKLVLREVKRIL